MNVEQFEQLLDEACRQLTREVQVVSSFKTAKDFEDRVRRVLEALLLKRGVKADLSAAAQTFPDIAVGKFGVEVKFTTNDSWRCVANSVFEGTRKASIDEIYVVYGKLGGTPAARYRRYADAVMHVRTSHVPRFEVDIEATQSLFDKMGTTYAKFSKESDEEKMKYVRAYARGRLKKGERLWWLDDSADQPTHSLPVEVKLYMRLSDKEKRALRAEAALLCPQIFQGSRKRDKYTDPVMYMLTYRGVFCPQARDLFTAGSVALRADGTRGGRYLLRSIQDICEEIVVAANTLEDALFLEYWNESVPPNKRIKEWLKRIDDYAVGWTPSDDLEGILKKHGAKL